MEKQIVPFMFDGAEVRVIVLDSKPWFVARELSKVLGFKNAANNAKHVLREDEMRIEDVPVKIVHMKGTESVTGSAMRKMLLINESGLYALIMRSSKPEAQKFRYKVTNEILPSIVRSGSYKMPESVKRLSVN